MIDEKEMFVNAKIYREREFEQTKKTLAFHEAGHFVVQYITGLTPKATQINAAGDHGTASYLPQETGCKTPLEKMPIEIQREGACLLAAMFQAGNIAERIYTGTSVDGFVMSQGIDDQASRKLLSMVDLSPLCKYPDLLAKEILNNRWDLVEKVAERLLIDGCIEWTPEELDALEV